MELHIPAIEGIGGSALYLVDRYGGHTIYDVDFVPVGDAQVLGVGLTRIDHFATPAGAVSWGIDGVNLPPGAVLRYASA